MEVSSLMPGRVFLFFVFKHARSVLRFKPRGTIL